MCLPGASDHGNNGQVKQAMYHHFGPRKGAQQRPSNDPYAFFPPRPLPTVQNSRWATVALAEPCQGKQNDNGARWRQSGDDDSASKPCFGHKRRGYRLPPTRATTEATTPAAATKAEQRQRQGGSGTKREGRSGDEEGATVVF